MSSELFFFTDSEVALARLGRGGWATPFLRGGCSSFSSARFFEAGFEAGVEDGVGVNTGVEVKTGVGVKVGLVVGFLFWIGVVVFF